MPSFADVEQFKCQKESDFPFATVDQLDVVLFANPYVKYLRGQVVFVSLRW